MKVGAGGLQIHATHDEVANRQAQESRRTDSQPRPVVESETAEALNRNALNKTVEKNQDTNRAYNTLRQVRNREQENRRRSGRDGQRSGEGGSDTGREPGSRDENSVHRGFQLDKYI